MLREEKVFECIPNDEQSVWPVLGHDRVRQSSALPVAAAEVSQFRAEAATPDVPASIGMHVVRGLFRADRGACDRHRWDPES